MTRVSSDELAEFLRYSGRRFSEEKGWHDHVLVTAGGLIGATLGGAASKDPKAFGLGLLGVVGVNIILTVAHYAISYREWRKGER